MSDSTPDNKKQIAARIASGTNLAERQALVHWIEALLKAKELNLPALQKAKQAISLTADSKLIVGTAKVIAREFKRLSWDDRSLPARLGMGAATASALFFGGQAAGVAALGAAIGVPLWVVFGAGAAFMGILYEELTGKKLRTKTSYHVIEAERIDKPHE